MKRIFKFSILVIVLGLCGCGSKEPQPVSVQTEEPVQAAVPVPITDSESEPQNNPQNLQEIVEQLKQVSETGSLDAIVQGENCIFCVQNQEPKKKKGKNTVYCWDLKTGSSIKKELPCSLMRRDSYNVQQTDGYVVFYGDDQKVVVMDQNFDVVDELTIKDKLVDGRDRNYCVLPGEKKIVYTKEMLKKGEWYQEVNECDYNGKNKRQICRIEDATKSVGEVNRITELVVSKNEKILFFSGLYFKTADLNESAFPCFGGINRDTGNVVSIQEEKNPGHLLGDKMMFVDGLKERGVSSSGYVTCLDENGRQEKYSFDKKEESQEVTVSDGGNYYLSYERMEEGKTKVSCYPFEKSTYEWKRELPQYVSQIWYFEQAKTLLYAYYDDDSNLCFETEIPEEIPEEENYFDLEEVQNSGQNMRASFGFGVDNYDEDKGKIPYDGGELQIDFEVSPEDCSFDCSVLIYIDGILQRYALEPQGTLSEQHTVKADNRTTIISAYFTPQVDMGKKKHRMHFLCMYDPEFQPENGSTSYGHSHAISQVTPWELVVTGKCGKAEETIVSEKTGTISKEKRKAYESSGENNESYNMLDGSVHFEAERGKKEGEITFRVLGGVKAEYRISAYVGHKPVAFSNGAKYLDLSLDGKHMYEGSLPVGKLSDKEYDTLYFIAIPISNLGTAMVDKSSSICLYHGGIKDAANE